MKASEIVAIQKKVGAVPDGFWGPRSIAACQEYLRSLMPSPNPWPPQREVTEFFGPHGTPGGESPPMKSITLPFPVYFENKLVTTLHAHEKVADSLGRVFEHLKDLYPTEDERVASGVAIYDGLYNPRRIRGASAWSLHSWAIAIDFDAERNGNRVHWPTRAHMPIEVMECFAKEGWLSAGAFWGRDAMHMQATQ
jgi:D-alanyl-D-alanine carboxypeptidase